jgi:hypothetical protein
MFEIFHLKKYNRLIVITNTRIIIIINQNELVIWTEEKPSFRSLKNISKNLVFN